MKKVWILILILAAWVYFPLLSAGPLAWDDDSNIFANPFFRADMWWPFWKQTYFGLYVPVTTFVWQVLYKIGAGSPAPYRYLNLLLHLANITLLILILRRWIGPKVTAASLILAAAIFALHPFQVETVAWISGGRDLLSSLFALSAIYTLCLGAQWVATLFFALALLSKPSLVVLPAAMVLYGLCFRDRKPLLSWSKIALWLVGSVTVIAATIGAQSEHLPSIVWWKRPWVVLDSYQFYLQKIVWPAPLSANYARTPEFVLADITTLGWGLVAFTLMGLLALKLWRSHRNLFYLSGLWVLGLLPVSGLVSFGFQKISTVADHYHYLPMACWAAAVAVLASNASKIPERFLFVGATILTITLTYLSWSRVQVWQNDTSFFQDMAQTAPEAYTTAMGMSVVACHEQKDFVSGVRWTKVALRERPLDMPALSNQAYCWLHAKRYDEVMAMEGVLQVLDRTTLAQKQPTSYSSFLATLGTALIEAGSATAVTPQAQLARGFQYLCEAYGVLPTEPGHWRNLRAGEAYLQRKGLTPQCPFLASPPANTPQTK